MGRLENAQKIVRQEKLDALLIEEPLDLFYLTGLHFSSGKLLIESKRVSLFLDGRYLASAASLKKYEIFPLEEFAVQGIVGFDQGKTSYERYQDLLAKGVILVPLKNPIRELRAIKEEKEIKALKKSAELLQDGLYYIQEMLQEGISELELARALELFWLEWGATSVSFSPIIAFGENSAYPHHRAGETRLKKGDIVLVDIGVTHGSYVSDMTRTFFFGKPNPKLKKIYDVVEKAQAAALKKCKAGVNIKDVVASAKKVINDNGFEKFFPHSLGHGVGLEIHELPFLREEGILKPNMVITIEPGIYVPGLGGVRIEDTIVIKEKGYEIITDENSK